MRALSLQISDGKNDTLVRDFFRGGRRPSVDFVLAVSQALEINIDDALGRDGGRTGRVLSVRVTAMPTDLNPYGGVFGGWLISQMALGAGSLASRHGKGKAVVVSATDFAFPGAMQVGDELSVYCEIAATGNTSLTINAEAIARERNSEAETKVASGTFKFVMLDENDRPRAVSEQWV